VTFALLPAPKPREPEDDMPAKPITYPYLTRSADFEVYDGRRHRVRLARSWAPLESTKPGTILWLMCNPSDADGDHDDMTITKCRGFGERWGYISMIIHNRYTLVATQAADLGAAIAAGYPPQADADNAQRIAADLERAALVVCAWGEPPGSGLIPHEVEAWCRSFVPHQLMHVIGLTSAGVPRHPSRAGYVAEPTPWPGSAPCRRCKGSGLFDIWTGRCFRQEVCTCRFGWEPLPR
jgi:hypothetical protein